MSAFGASDKDMDASGSSDGDLSVCLFCFETSIRKSGCCVLWVEVSKMRDEMLCPLGSTSRSRSRSSSLSLSLSLATVLATVLVLVLAPFRSSFFPFFQNSDELEIAGTA